MNENIRNEAGLVHIKKKYVLSQIDFQGNNQIIIINGFYFVI